MRIARTRLAPLAALAALCAHTGCLLHSARAAETRPNLVLIVADDLGWRDVGFMGNTGVDTPNLDKLAAGGVVFSQAYASAPNCAPTRACLLTGQYTPRHGIYTVVDPRHEPGSPHHRLLAASSRPDLPEATLTLAEALRSGGYATGLVGMWNLGRGRSGPATPTGQGFDFYTEPKRLGFEPDTYRRASDGADVSDALTEAALQWIDTTRAGDTPAAQRPFFLYLAYHAVHEPYDPKPELLEKYRRRPGVSDPAQAATIETLDANVGRLVEGLRARGLTGTTHVVFTSDNGGTRRFVAPLRGGKGTLYEGGLRVPQLWTGPGVTPGLRVDDPVASHDLFPTLLALAAVPLPRDRPIDGVSLLPLRSRGGHLAPRPLFWHFPCYMTTSGPMGAVREGNLKLVEHFETRTCELFDLATDPGETKDLATERTTDRDRLLARLKTWQRAVAAPVPSETNPAYVPGSDAREKRDRNKTPRTQKP